MTAISVEQVAAEKVARYVKPCALTSCNVVGVPKAGDTDPKTGTVVHFCSNGHRDEWVSENRPWKGDPHRQMHGDGMHY